MNGSATVHRRLTLLTAVLVGGVVLFAGVVALAVSFGEIEPPFPGTAVRLGGLLLGLGVLGAAHRTAAHSPGDPARGREDPARLFTRVLIAQAMREGVGMLGGVIGYLTGDLLPMAALVAASVAALLVGLPRREEWRRRTGS